jgi:hypothetical protein
MWDPTHKFELIEFIIQCIEMYWMDVLENKISKKSFPKPLVWMFLVIKALFWPSTPLGAKEAFLCICINICIFHLGKWHQVSLICSSLVVNSSFQSIPILVIHSL